MQKEIEDNSLWGSTKSCGCSVCNIGNIGLNVGYLKGANQLGDQYLGGQLSIRFTYLVF